MYFRLIGAVFIQCLLVNFVYAADTIKCASALEDRTATLKCPTGQVVKGIAFASYGLPTGSCGAYVAGKCHSSSSLIKVQTMCAGKASCSIKASNSVFGDPCVGADKKLNIQAVCTDPAAPPPANSSPTPTPTPTPVPPSSNPPPATTSGIMWGTNGATEQGTYAPSGTISLAQQSADLLNVFGLNHGPILYRAMGDGQSDSEVKTVVSTLLSKGITPLPVVQGYPNYKDETTAYNSAYARVQSMLKAVPGITIVEIGNEWDLQMSPNGDGIAASHWNTLAKYPMFRGTLAGATAAIRDFNDSIKVVGGANAGWTDLGLPLALAQDMKSYKTPSGTIRNLLWDYTNLHWYNDAKGNNQMGLPSSFNGGMNAYKILQATGRPICITEFGSSSGNTAGGSSNATGAETQAGKNMAALMTDFKAHQNTENGIVCGVSYQLYQQIEGVQQYDYFMYYTQSNFSTVLAPQGQAMKNWLLAN